MIIVVNLFIHRLIAACFELIDYASSHSITIDFTEVQPKQVKSVKKWNIIFQRHVATDICCIRVNHRLKLFSLIVGIVFSELGFSECSGATLHQKWW